MSPRTRRRRGLIAFLVALVILVGAAAALDEVARRVAESRAASELQRQIGTSQSVGVDFGGWPFSMALVTGRVSDMHITMPSLTTRRTGSDVTIGDVDVVADGVHDVRHPSSAIADRLSVSGTISWAELSQHVGSTIAWADGGRARFTRSIDVLGTATRIEITAVPGIDPATHKVTLTDARATVAGVTVPAALLAQAASTMAQRITLPNVNGLTYQNLAAEQGGLRVTLGGDNVALDSLR